MKRLAQLLYTVVLLSLLVACVAPAPATESTTAASTMTTFPITIQHEDGETTFTKPVERIVTLSEEMMELPIALGVYPVGAASERTPNAEQGKPFTYSYAEAVSQSAMTYVGLESAPSLEAIALLQPDLIITPNGYGKERYAQLTQIAPTLTFDGADRLYWQAALPALAQLLGKEAAAQQVIATFDAKLSEARSQLAPVVATKPRLALLFLPAPTLTFMVNQQFAFGATLTDLGMAIVTPDSVTFNEAGSAQVSDEVVAQVETDAFIIFRFRTDRFTIDELLTSHPAPKLDYIINTERPAAGPITDFDYLRDLAALLVNAHGSAAPAAAFPVTIDHQFGSTTIEAKPQRVISLGYSEVDPILALGVQPIAVREWFGEQPYAVWPWAQAELGDATPEVINMPFGELNFEALAAMQPDLIVATHSGITPEEYETLAQIAPTLAQSDDYDDFSMPWQEQTRAIGLALGRSAEAEELVTAVEAQIAAAANPAFAAATISWITPADAPGEFWVTGQNTPPLRFLAALGFQYPDEVADLMGEQYSIKISSERLDLIDTTVLILRTPTQEALDAILADSIFQQLAVVKEGRLITFVGNDPVYGALSFSTVDSLPFVVENLVPQLVAVVGE